MKGLAPRNLVLVTALGASLAGDARADIGPPPQCPAGLQPSYWEGHYCAPIACSSDGDCGSEKCVERAVCLYSRERSNLPNTDKQWEYRGECGSNPTCSDGACLTKKVCTTKAGSAGVNGPAGGKRGCGCAMPGGEAGTAMCVFGVAAVAGLLLGRRRGRGGRGR